MTENSVVGSDWHVMDPMDAKDPRFGELPPAERSMLSSLQLSIDDTLAGRDTQGALKRMEGSLKQLPSAPTRSFLPLLHQVVQRAIRGLADISIGPVLAGALTAPPHTVEALDVLLQTFPKVGLEMDIEVIGGGAKPRYIVTGKKLGEGATAKVFLGFDVRTSAVRAVKRLHWQDLVRRLPDMERSFNQEISLMMSLNSPNIVKLFDQIRPADGRYVYLLMEYCGGGTLRDLIERHKAARSHLNEDQVRTVLLDVALAMQCLQNQNPKIIHRDLKPDNLLLVDAARFNVKLADFTLARQVSDASQLMNSYVGTPLYMAPEVLWRQAYTEKADLYSIGVILFELLFGTRPFDAQHSVDELRHNVRSNDVVFPKGHSLSPECSDLLSHLLKKDAHARLSWIEFFNHDFLRKNERKLSNTSVSSPSDPAQIIAKLKKDLEAAERRAMEAQAHDLALKRMLTEAEQRALTAEASIPALTSSLANRDFKITELHKEIAALKATPVPAPVQQSPPPQPIISPMELEKLRSQVSQLENTIKENEVLKNSLRDTDSKLRNAKIRQAELEVALDTARKGDSASKQLSDSLDKANKQVTSIHSRCAALEAELVTARNQAAAATGMVANLQASVTLHEKTIAELKKAGVPRASDGAEALLEMALADNEKLNKETAELKAKLASSQKEVESLSNSYVELLKELEKQGAQQHPQPPGQRR